MPVGSGSDISVHTAFKPTVSLSRQSFCCWYPCVGLLAVLGTYGSFAARCAALCRAGCTRGHPKVPASCLVKSTIWSSRGDACRDSRRSCDSTSAWKNILTVKQAVIIHRQMLTEQMLNVLVLVMSLQLKGLKLIEPALLLGGRHEHTCPCTAAARLGKT